MALKVTVWNEGRHEKTDLAAKAIYPLGIHNCIKSFLEKDGDLAVRTVTLDDPEQGLPDEVLNDTDVLIWWGHMAHKEVCEELVAKICDRVYKGKMGFIALHSAHHSKPFRALVGASGNLSWGRNQKEVIWNLNPSHEICRGIPDHFVLNEEELYAEPFYIPQPQELLFGCWFEDGYIFRGGATFNKGAGRVFYFQPGHETCRSFYNENVQRIIRNAVYWVRPNDIGYTVPDGAPKVEVKICDETSEY